MTKYSHRNKVCNSLIPRRRWTTTPRLILLDLRARRPRLWRRGPRGQAIRCVVLLIRGEISFNTGGSFSTSWMWKMSPGKLPCPLTWNNIKNIFFNIPYRKLGKNVILFHLNMNFFKVKQKKYHAF